MARGTPGYIKEIYACPPFITYSLNLLNAHHTAQIQFMLLQHSFSLDINCRIAFILNYQVTIVTIESLLSRYTDFSSSQLVQLFLFKTELLVLYRVNSSYLPAILDLDYEHMRLANSTKTQQCIIPRVQYGLLIIHLMYVLNNHVHLIT